MKRKRITKIIAVIMAVMMVMTLIPGPLTVQADSGETIKGFSALPEAVSSQSVAPGTKLEELVLPGKLEVITAEGTKTIEGITWKCIDPVSGYDDMVNGSYTFQALIPEAEVVEAGTVLPEIRISLGQQKDTEAPETAEETKATEAPETAEAPAAAPADEDNQPSRQRKKSRIEPRASNPAGLLFDISEGNVRIEPGDAAGQIKITYGSGLTTQTSESNMITITGSRGVGEFRVTGGITVNLTIRDLSINRSTAGVTGNSQLNLTIEGNNELIGQRPDSGTYGSSQCYPGLEVAAGSSLTITSESTGLLTAEGGKSYKAGIGGYPESEGYGTITINGGRIVAKGANIESSGGTGIGAMNGSGTIIINGGMVTAIGGTRLGGGTYPGLGTRNPGGSTIVINGGSVQTNGCSNQPKNSVGENVYPNTLTVGAGTAVSNGVITNLLLDGAADPYGLHQVKTDDSGKLYFYLPQNESASAAVQVDANGVRYGKGYLRNTSAQDHVLLQDAPEINFPTTRDDSYPYGKTLNEIELVNGTSGRGGFAWVDDTAKPTVDNTGYAVAFTPNDLDTYNYSILPGWDSVTQTIRRMVSVKVTPAKVTEVDFPTVGEITYGQTLAEVSLSGGSSQGSFVWADETVEPNVNNDGYELIFTPNDLDNYDYSGIIGWDAEAKKVKRTVIIKVNPAAASEVDFPTAAEVTYKAILADSDLTGGTAGRGGFAWEDGTIVPTVVNDGYTVEFTPDDVVNYNYNGITGWDAEAKKVKRKVIIKVNPAAASEVDFPTAADVTYEATLADSVLTGGTAGRGSFAWADGTIVPTVANNGYTVVFTPSDVDNYNYSGITGWDAEAKKVKRTVNIKVNPAAASEVDFPTAADVTYEATLADSVLTGGTAGRGSFAWADTAIVPTVKNSGYMAVFTPADLDNYDYSQVADWDNTTRTVRRTIPVTVHPVEVSETDVVFPKAGEIYEGDTLEFAELTGGSTDKGSFAWEDAKIVPTIKNKGYTVIFTPNDADNYDYSKVPGWDAETRTVRRLVLVKVIKESPTAESYKITVQKTGNGTAKASVSRARAGKKITLTASPASGYRFKGWQVVSGDITIKDSKFTMPEEDVTVRAVFERVTGTNTNRYTRNTTTRSPRTGDNNQVLPYVLLALAALCGIGMAGYRRKTKS